MRAFLRIAIFTVVIIFIASSLAFASEVGSRRAKGNYFSVNVTPKEIADYKQDPSSINNISPVKPDIIEDLAKTDSRLSEAVKSKIYSLAGDGDLPGQSEPAPWSNDAQESTSGNSDKGGAASPKTVSRGPSGSNSPGPAQDNGDTTTSKPSDDGNVSNPDPGNKRGPANGSDPVVDPGSGDATSTPDNSDPGKDKDKSKPGKGGSNPDPGKGGA